MKPTTTLAALACAALALYGCEAAQSPTQLGPIRASIQPGANTYVFKFQRSTNAWVCIDDIGDTVVWKNPGYVYAGNNGAVTLSNNTDIKGDTSTTQEHWVNNHSFGSEFGISVNGGSEYAEPRIKLDSVANNGASWWTISLQDGSGTVSLSSSTILADNSGAFRFATIATSPACP